MKLWIQGDYCTHKFHLYYEQWAHLTTAWPANPWCTPWQKLYYMKYNQNRHISQNLNKNFPLTSGSFHFQLIYDVFLFVDRCPCIQLSALRNECRHRISNSGGRNNFIWLQWRKVDGSLTHVQRSFSCTANGTNVSHLDPGTTISC